MQPKFNKGDRVVHQKDIKNGGTIVSDGKIDYYGWVRYDVLWDCENSVDTSHMQDCLYPESIKMTENRQPDFEKRIKKLEELSKRISITG